MLTLIGKGRKLRLNYNIKKASTFKKTPKNNLKVLFSSKNKNI